jgi:hypothetical protein
LKPLVIFLHHDALCRLTNGHRFQPKAGVDGANGFVRRHVVRPFILEPLDSPLLEEQSLLPEPLSVLLHPPQVLPLSLFTGVPIDLGDALLPAVSRRPVL